MKRFYQIILTFLAAAGLLLAAACSSAALLPTAAPTASPTPSAAVIQLSADPDPITGRVCTGCGDQDTSQREAVTDLTIRETAGIGGKVTLIALSLKEDGTDTVLASGEFDSSAVEVFAGSSLLPASGSLVVPHLGVHYDGSEAGIAATLTYTVTVTDDNGNQITLVFLVKVTT